MKRIFLTILWGLCCQLLYGQTCETYTPSTQVHKKLSYQERDNGSCEGFIKDKSSATRIEVVSFTYGEFKYDSKVATSIDLQTPEGFESSLSIEAKGIPLSLDYRMNATISNKDVLAWDTGAVLLQHEEAKKYQNIGVTGYLLKTGNEDKTFVPLRIRDNQYPQYLFLILRSNGSLRTVKWKTNMEQNWHEEAESFGGEESIELIFKDEKGINEITIKGVNGLGEDVLAKFSLQLK